MSCSWARVTVLFEPPVSVGAIENTTVPSLSVTFHMEIDVEKKRYRVVNHAGPRLSEPRELRVLGIRSAMRKPSFDRSSSLRLHPSERLIAVIIEGISFRREKDREYARVTPFDPFHPSNGRVDLFHNPDPRGC